MAAQSAHQLGLISQLLERRGRPDETCYLIDTLWRNALNEIARWPNWTQAERQQSALLRQRVVLVAFGITNPPRDTLFAMKALPDCFKMPALLEALDWSEQQTL